MSRELVTIFALLFAWGCAAEGTIDSVDAGLPDVDVPDATSELADATTDASQPTDAALTICDPLAPACPAGQKCVPNSDLGQSVCVAAGTENAVGDTCVRSTDCVEGAVCISETDGAFCRELCDKDDIDSCAGDQTYCLKTLGSDPSIGVCGAGPEPCDIYSQDCEEGACVLLQNPVDGTTGAYCGTPGSVAVGQPCGGSAGSCTAGAICVQADGAPSPTCHAVCRDADVPCAAGACTGTSGSGIDFCV